VIPTSSNDVSPAGENAGSLKSKMQAPSKTAKDENQFAKKKKRTEDTRAKAKEEARIKAEQQRPRKKMN
jgi:hypothetical protein